jgi:dihydroorotase
MLVGFFDQHDAMERFDGFVQRHALEFYNLKKITNKVRVSREEWRVPFHINGIVPFYAGKTLSWRL